MQSAESRAAWPETSIADGWVAGPVNELHIKLRVPPGTTHKPSGEGTVGYSGHASHFGYAEALNLKLRRREARSSLYGRCASVRAEMPALPQPVLVGQASRHSEDRMGGWVLPDRVLANCGYLLARHA